MALRVVAHVCPGVLASCGLAPGDLVRLSDNLYETDFDPGGDKCRWLPRLAWDLVEVVCDETRGANESAGRFTARLEGVWGELGVSSVVAVSRGLNKPASMLGRKLDGEGVLQGVLCRRRALVVRPMLPWLSDRFNAAAIAALRAARISRAEVKFTETAALLDHFDLPARAQAPWLDLGASPGGISRLLAAFGPVTAVDLAPLHPDVAALNNVHPILADALTWRSEQAFGGIVCDMNGLPLTALCALVRHAADLKPGGALAWTIKLPGWSALSDVLAQADGRLAEVGVRRLRVQRFMSHRRHEVAWIGCKARL